MIFLMLVPVENANMVMPNEEQLRYHEYGERRGGYSAVGLIPQTGAAIAWVDTTEEMALEMEATGRYAVLERISPPPPSEEEVFDVANV